MSIERKFHIAKLELAPVAGVQRIAEAVFTRAEIEAPAWWWLQQGRATVTS